MFLFVVDRKGRMLLYYIVYERMFTCHMTMGVTMGTGWCPLKALAKLAWD